MERMVRASPENGAFILHDIPQGTHEVNFIASSPSYGPKEAVTSVSPDSASDLGRVSFFPYRGWRHSRIIGFNTTASGADVRGNVDGFPALVRLHSGNFNFNQAGRNGGDLRFAKSDSTPLPFEIERWDSLAGHAEVWVKIDTVFGASDRQFMTMYWGAPAADPAGSINSASSPPPGEAAVFDTANGVQGVWHLSDAENDSIRDATENRFNGLSPDSARPEVSEGVIGNCRRFDGKADFITMPGTAAGKLDFPQNGRYSVSAWVMADTFTESQQTLVSKDKHQYFLWLSQTDWQFSEYQDRAGWQSSAMRASVGEWVLLTGVRDGAAQYLYVNGMLADTLTSKAFTDPRSTAGDLILGRAHEPGTFPNAQAGFCYFRGKIDEVRIGSAPSGADWIKLCYMNQRSNDKLTVFK
jgi:biopolymer transport protein ExbB